MSTLAPLVIALIAAGLVGCAPVAPSEPTHPPTDLPTISAIRTHKCGSCHIAPEPKSRSKDKLDAAVGRHKRRVRLSGAQWAAMVDYLAASD